MTRLLGVPVRLRLRSGHLGPVWWYYQRRTEDNRLRLWFGVRPTERLEQVEHIAMFRRVVGVAFYAGPHLLAVGWDR